jgi:hypothetical protein
MGMLVRCHSTIATPKYHELSVVVRSHSVLLLAYGVLICCDHVPLVLGLMAHVRQG